MHRFCDRMAGMMTARFLLHLRKWEVKHSCSVTGEPSNGKTARNSHLEFKMDPSQGASRSYIDDFGEDPVRRAKLNREQQSSYLSFSNFVLEQRA